MSVAFRVVEDADLRARNTFGVAARAPVLVEVDDIASLPDAFARHAAADRPPLLLGGGSNLLFAGDPEGAVLSLSAAGIRIVDDHGTHAIVRAEAGAVWHDLVVLMRAGVDDGRIDTVRPEHTPEAMGRPPRVDAHGGEVYVYRRAGLPCLVCGTEVRTRLLEGRNLYWCPRCQRRSRAARG